MRLRIWFGWFWLLVFVNAVAPKSFLHAFHAHEETCHGAEHAANISLQHEHCDFLLLQLFSCIAADHQVVFIQSLANFSPVVLPVSVFDCGVPSEKHLRGPPTC